MFPLTISSVLIPSPMSIAIIPLSLRAALNRSNSCNIPIPARTERSASSSLAKGRPNTAMIASPMNLSNMPPSFWRQSTIRVKYSFSRPTVPWAPRLSVRVVKLRTSENNTEASLIFPPRTSLPVAIN